jgi:hypothetical protein
MTFEAIQQALVELVIENEKLRRNHTETLLIVTQLLQRVTQLEKFSSAGMRARLEEDFAAKPALD